MAKQDSDRTQSVKQQRRTSPSKPYLAFSIDSILGRRDVDKTALNPTQALPEKEARARGESEEQPKTLPTEDTMDSTNFRHLPWLAYTRYSPPKLPSEYVVLLFI